MSIHPVVQKMYDNDAFSQWLGIKILRTHPEPTVLSMTVRSDMCNGFGIAHGGVTYSLADSALAFASNSHGRHAVSIDTSIAHLAAAKVGDMITATVSSEQLGHKTGHYLIQITNQEKKIIAQFNGSVYRKSAQWEV